MCCLWKKTDQKEGHFAGNRNDARGKNFMINNNIKY